MVSVDDRGLQFLVTQGNMISFYADNIFSSTRILSQ